MMTQDYYVEDSSSLDLELQKYWEGSVKLS